MIFCFLKGPLQNIGEVIRWVRISDASKVQRTTVDKSAGQTSSQVRSGVYALNEHFEPIFNTEVTCR